MSPSLPDPVRCAVSDALSDGSAYDATAMSVTPVSGGSINQAARLTFPDGRSVFVKWNARAPADMFHAEADGLRALRAAALRLPETLRVPEVLGIGDADDAPAWLLLEDLPGGRPTPDCAERLGRGLAGLHRAHGPTWGWTRENFIGSLQQSNRASATWPAFWRDRRLAPQLRLALDQSLLSPGEARAIERVLDRLDTVLAGAESDGPSLLHGDLWSGNAYAGPEGDAVIIDPAVYRGHREVDLAMTELFGGFPGRFHDAYDEAWPLSPGYREQRRDCYQLYYLLVHVNLFGRGYVGGVMERVRRLET